MVRMMVVIAAKPAQRWKRRKSARPAELIAAALELFVERGFAATRMDDVARRAAVSKGTLYLYFKTKEELFKAVVRQSLVPVIAEAEQLIGRHQGSTRELLTGIVKNWWTQVGNTSAVGIPKLMISESGNFPDLARFYLEEVIDRARTLIAHALQKGVRQGELRAVDVDHAVQVVAAGIVFLAVWLRSFHGIDPKRLDPEKYLDTYIAILFDGLARKPSP
jgi:AcrR family transcriptional regulator